MEARSMKLLITGCSHHNAPVEIRERLAFSDTRAREALDQLRLRFPRAESVVLSTCNRVELYLLAESPDDCPAHGDVVNFLATFHGVDEAELFEGLYERSGDDAVRHLFTVAASLDSMVVGEPQILAQVKQAYELARTADSAGPLTHAAFQWALRVAKRVASETAIHSKRVSIPSIAVLEVAREVFDRFDDKHVLVIGAGEMSRETLAYLRDLGVRHISVVNRSLVRAEQLAAEFGGTAHPWERLDELLAAADFVVSTTGASDPVVTLERYCHVEKLREQRPQLILDLAVPRDFEPQIEQCIGVYLYSVDDLARACEANRAARQREWPRAEAIIEEETSQFMAELHHRATGPTIRRLKERADELRDEELSRLFARLEHLDERSRREIEYAFNRLVNKILHPPLESLRGEAQGGAPHGLLHALKRLFQLED
jgi:glutamyl-tRNA reductase